MQEGIFDQKICRALHHLELLHQPKPRPRRADENLFFVAEDYFGDNYADDQVAIANQSFKSDMVMELLPSVLDKMALGLKAVLEWLAHAFSQQTGIEYVLDFDDGELSVGRELKLPIFQIFKETLKNVTRHSRASEVIIELKELSGEVMLIVSDNGEGIAPYQAADSASLGLLGIRDRTRALGGNISFVGSPDQGSAIIVHIPASISGG